MILCVYDLDDTLVHNSARVRLRHADGTVTRFETPTSYRNHSLVEGESFDYTEYEDPTIFEENTTLLPFFDFAKGRGGYEDHYHQIILTARKRIPGDEVIPRFLTRHGLRIPDHRYYPSGGIHGNPCIAKPAFLRTYLQTMSERGTKFKGVFVYDDREDVLQAIGDCVPEATPVLVENIFSETYKLKPLL